MKRLKDIESAGWGFYGIALLLLYGPCTLLVWNYTNELVSIGTRLGLGLVLAATFAAFATWGVNSALHHRNLRRYQEAQEFAKKEKRRKNKKKKKRKK